MKVLAITQARTGSTRLPNKILKKINEETLLEIHIQRILKSKKIDKLIIATTTAPADDAIARIGEKVHTAVYRGSEDDVLDRFYQTAKTIKPEWVVRLTSDCPLIDPILIDQVIELAQKENADYCSNTLLEKFPDGQDVEVFKFTALEEAWKYAKLNSEREHVTPYIRKNSTMENADRFKSLNFDTPEDYGYLRMTVDEPKDFDLIEKLVIELGTDKSWQEYVSHILEHQLFTINTGITRNEGLLKSLKKD